MTFFAAYWVGQKSPPFLFWQWISWPFASLAIARPVQLYPQSPSVFSLCFATLHSPEFANWRMNKLVIFFLISSLALMTGIIFVRSSGERETTLYIKRILQERVNFSYRVLLILNGRTWSWPNFLKSPDPLPSCPSAVKNTCWYFQCTSIVTFNKPGQTIIFRFSATKMQLIAFQSVAKN